MKTADDVLQALVVANLEQHHPVYGSTSEAKQQLLADLLAIVGEDDPDPIEMKRDTSRKNAFRAELRQALRSYFGDSVTDNEGDNDD